MIGAAFAKRRHPVVDPERPVPYEIDKRIPTEYAEVARAVFLGECSPTAYRDAMSLQHDDMTMLACLANAKSVSEHERHLKQRAADKRKRKSKTP